MVGAYERGLTCKLSRRLLPRIRYTKWLVILRDDDNGWRILLYMSLLGSLLPTAGGNSMVS